MNWDESAEISKRGYKVHLRGKGDKTLCGFPCRFDFGWVHPSTIGLESSGEPCKRCLAAVHKEGK